MKYFIGDNMERLKQILKSTKILNILMAVITYGSICLLGVLKTYDVVSWFIFLVLVLFFCKTDINNKIMKKENIFLSILFSFVIIFGSIVNELKYNTKVNIFRIFFTFKNFIYIVGIFNLLYIVLTNVMPKLYSYSIKKGKSIFKSKKFMFITCFLIIMLCWMPYFLSFYPGNLSPDSISELTTVINNFANASDHHPIIHILFIAIPYKIVFGITNNMTISVAAVTLTQMIVMASIFSSLIVFLHNRKVKDKILFVILAYYAILPMHGYYSIVMWKDVIFSGLLLLLTMELVKIIEKQNNNKLNFKQLISFIIVSIFCVFFRNNAIYMYFLLAIVTFIFFRKYYKIFISAFVIVFGVYYIIKGPVFEALNITKSSSSEYIGMPLQQIGRMAYKDVKFTKKEKETLNKLMPLKEMKKAYNPIISDGIKFNSYYNSNVFDENKGEYLKLWLGLIKKYPSIALEAYSISTLGYWYPGVSYGSVCYGIVENDYGLKNDPKLGNQVQYFLFDIEKRGVPILNIEWSIGLCFWLILVFAILTVKKLGKKALYIYVPVFGIWLTMMAASPVYAEFRYVYGAFTCLPLLMLIPYINFKSKD